MEQISKWPIKVFIFDGIYVRYVVRGGMQDFNYHFSNCIELTFELSCCKFPPASELKGEWENNREAILTFLEMAHMGIKGIVVNKATGKPVQGSQTLFLFLFFTHV